METTFRIAQRADMETLLELVREYYEFDHHPYDREVVRAALAGILDDESFGRVWLIQDSDTPIGYLVLTLGYSLEYHGRDAFIDELYIRASHRGQGVGRRALVFVEDAARALGVHALHLEVDRANTAALEVYRRVGFRDEDSYLMTKSPTASKSRQLAPHSDCQ